MHLHTLAYTQAAWMTAWAKAVWLPVTPTPFNGTERIMPPPGVTNSPHSAQRQAGGGSIRLVLSIVEACWLTSERGTLVGFMDEP